MLINLTNKAKYNKNLRLLVDVDALHFFNILARRILHYLSCNDSEFENILLL